MFIRRGQSIVETVIAAALISIALIAALSLSTRSERQTSYARNSAEATKYASQAGDWFRTQRNSLGWATLVAKAQAESVNNLAVYCLNSIPNNFDDLSLATGECDSLAYIPNTYFTRAVVVDTSLAATGILKVTVSVSWQEKSIRQTTLELELTSWQ